VLASADLTAQIETANRGITYSVDWVHEDGTLVPNTAVEDNVLIYIRLRERASGGVDIYNSYIFAYYSFGIDGSGVYGPIERAELDTIDFVTSTPGVGPDQATMEALLPDFIEMRFAQSSGVWAVCFPNNFENTIAAFSDFDVNTNNAIGSSTIGVAYIRHSVQWFPMAGTNPSYPFALAELQVASGHSLPPSMSFPAIPFCTDVLGEGGGPEPGPLWVPDVPYPIWEEFTPPDLPELPESSFVPPEVLPESAVDSEMPEAFDSTGVSTELELAMARWKARLGLPNHHSIFSIGPYPAEFDVIEFDFQVASINVPITIDFDAWRPQLSLFGYLLNAAAVVWVLSGVYDAVRRA
jgi:hypothetical protein